MINDKYNEIGTCGSKVKASGENELVYVNFDFSYSVTKPSKLSLYVSPYLVSNQGGRYTKHIYIGAQRIMSKLGDFDSYGTDPRILPYAGDGIISIDYKNKYNMQQQRIRDNYMFFDLPYNGSDNNNYVDGKGFCCEDVDYGRLRSFDPDKNVAYESAQFYYHPDHLGSSSYITNLDGEVFIEERNNVWNTPYLFNAKELDEETGMYYYGARCYDPRISLWISTDPLQEKYPNISTYCYTRNNPVIFIDFNGEEPTGK